MGERVKVINGKHGRIVLTIPDRKPTEEEWRHLHKIVAEIIVNEYREKEKEQQKADQAAL